MTSERNCNTCAFGQQPSMMEPCLACITGEGLYSMWTAPAGHNGGPPLDLPKVDPSRAVSLSEDPELRAQYPLFDGFLAYFPNAAAEVSRLSYLATQQHHPDEPMHWDRSKSTDHLNKIGRHMIDAGKLDDRGLRHSVMLAWRAMANLQEELERDLGLPPSPASRNRPY